jgi:hypothetical protein
MEVHASATAEAVEGVRPARVGDEFAIEHDASAELGKSL